MLTVGRLAGVILESCFTSSGSCFAVCVLLFLRFFGGLSSSGEVKPGAVLAAIVFLRQDALLVAACDRMAFRNSSLRVSEGFRMLMNIAI